MVSKDKKEWKLVILQAGGLLHGVLHVADVLALWRTSLPCGHLRTLWFDSGNCAFEAGGLQGGTFHRLMRTSGRVAVKAASCHCTDPSDQDGVLILL